MPSINISAYFPSFPEVSRDELLQAFFLWQRCTDCCLQCVVLP